MEHTSPRVRTLSNGLTIIAREQHDAPVASFWVWYRVGSRNEMPGLTGISHWVEHMQFKGTERLPKGAIFQSVSRVGGTLNAFTSQDWTAYFMTLPVQHLDLALEIESDRMINSRFDLDETESERTVILSERQGSENAPTFHLSEEVSAAAFRAHPYGHSVIGLQHDLQTIQRDDLYAHYRAAYRPDNAVVVAVGDVPAGEFLDRIEAAFGALPAGATLPPVRAAEPEQQAQRRITVHDPAPTAYLSMAFKAPAASDPDAVPLLALDAVLSGGKPMGLASGGPMGRSSRLYRSLVSTGLARAASSGASLSIDPNLFTVNVTAIPGAEPERIESVVWADLVRLAQEPVASDELERARKQVRAQFVYSAEGVTSQAFWLGYTAMVDRWERSQTLAEEIASVSADDIMRVAERYLRVERSTVGWLLPSGPGGGGAPTDRPALLPQVFALSGGETEAGRNRYGFERLVTSNGIVVLGQARASDPSVTARLRLATGSAADPTGAAGLNTLTARMMPRGSEQMTYEALNQATDNLGASLNVEPGREHTDVAIRCLVEDLPQLLQLARSILQVPTFPEDELEKVRQELLTAIREQDDDTRAVASLTLRKLLYPEGHPYRHRTIGEADFLLEATTQTLQRHHRAHFGPAGAVAAVVGGVPDVATATALIEDAFGSWQSDATPLQPVPLPHSPEAPIRIDEHIAGKRQADIAMGGFGPARSHPAYQAYDTANLILGRLGLMGRLGASVRDRQGLAYYAFSSVDAGVTGSSLTAAAGVDPANTERTIGAIREELIRLRSEPVRDDELADAKSYLTGVVPLALESKAGVAALLLSIERFQLGLDYVDRYPDIIAALTAGDLLQAAQQFVDPARMATAVAGP